ncbi:hypothetical protein IP92_04658 [Pseudoduganella flava]|uniref:Type II secretion system protein n=1 Tax=Pseudoduganella flava TaxID=871742 RepID=A0A562PI81_9BURK|nr:hypothetical protein [Pseudoduganella flava]QGZ42764.1 hypothetical protein GO485_29485 [Pseudoduganella flava]TWI44139.1 hypothetical protein IP92_04658 [Pseudoduganella flava]
MKLRQQGATLLEFAVTAGVWAILAGVLLFYVLRYQASAEVAGARWQVEQMRSALLGRVVEANLADPAQQRALAGINPVSLLRNPPAAYLGEFDNATFAEIPRGSWYFDRKQQILVYLFNGNKSFFEDTPERWVFRVEFTCLPTNNAKPPGTPGTNCGVALHQVDG